MHVRAYMGVDVHALEPPIFRYEGLADHIRSLSSVTTRIAIRRSELERDGHVSTDPTQVLRSDVFPRDGSPSGADQIRRTFAASATCDSSRVR